MGYDLTLFIGEVDEEFLCSICKMVLKDPVQDPCEHLFCNACIKTWLSIDESCPVSRKPVKISDLKPSNRTCRNLWNKLEIKCEFQPDGCAAIIKLENLATHVGTCEYNLNSEIVCDKGCNMTITRREYNINNCFSHLANAQEKEMIKLRDELSDQKEHFVRIVNGLRVEIRKLNDEVNRQQSQLEHQENALRRHQQQTAALSDKSNISWRERINMKIEESNILESDDHTSRGLVQSEYRLEPGKSYFRILALSSTGYPYIGLTSDVRNWFINYSSDGNIYVNNIKVHDGQEWKMGDMIECGIKFPTNFIDDGNQSATIYFSRNEELISEKSFTIPKDGLFPTICIYGKDTRLQYFQ